MSSIVMPSGFMDTSATEMEYYDGGVDTRLVCSIIGVLGAAAMCAGLAIPLEYIALKEVLTIGGALTLFGSLYAMD